MKERQLTVLIADNAAEDRAAMRDALSRDPAIRYVVIEAESGLRALELRRARKLDCLILDHHLPDLSALEALKKLAAEEGAVDCAVVVLVGAGDVRLAVKAMESGAYGCIEKDRARGEELLRVVSDAIEKAQRRRGAEPERMAVGEWRLVAKAAATAGAGSRPERADHKRSEEQLRLLKTAIEQSNESVMIMTAQLDPPSPRIVYVNSAFTKMTGYAPEEVIGKTPRILDGPKTDRAVLDQLRKNCAAGKVFRGETIKYRKDGSEFILEWTAGPVRNERGEVTHFVATERDVTERRRIEEALRRSEVEFRSMFELSAIGMAQVSPDFRYFRVNRKFCQMLGHSEQELLGRTFLDVTHPDDREVSAALAAAGFAGEEAESYVEKRYVRKDGEVIWALVNWAVIPDPEGRPMHTVASVQDITARKRTEEALRASEERYRLLTEISPDGVVVADEGGTIHLANQAMRRMLGVMPEQMIGRKFFDFFPPRCVQQYRDCLTGLLAGNLPENQVEIVFRREDGKLIPVEISAVCFDWKGRRFAQFIIHDVSQRKQAEAERERLIKEIEAERNRLRQILEQLPIGVYIAEAPSGRPIFCNHEAESLLRHPLLESDDYRGYAQYGALREDGSPYRAEDYPFSRTLIYGEAVKGEEMRYRRGDGTETILSVDSAPISDSKGRRMLAVATFIDIAERRHAEEALRESEERFAKAFLASPDGIVIIRVSDGVILEVNDSWRSLFGYARDEVVGKSWTQFDFLVDDDERRRAGAILEEQGYGRDFEMAVKRRSGEVRLVTLWAELLQLRGEDCLLVIVRDITDRKRAEEALRKSEEQARRQLAYVEAIYATAPVGLCFVDTDLRYLGINERLAEINRRPVKDHIGRTVREVSPDAADTLEPVFRRVIETGEPALNLEQSVATDAQPGVVRHFIASFYPIMNGGGLTLGVNVVVMEITERKKIEEELERLLREEKAAREEAEAANRMKDEFLATVSHELRTPLTSILGWARLLTGGGLTTPQARHALDVIAESAQSQTQLIEDILDTSRIITGRFKLDAQPVEIEHVFHAAVDVIRPSAEAKGVVLSEVVEAPDGVVLGDDNRLRQAVWNLLSNAVKFTSMGGRVEARLGRAEGQIEITVKDTGIGIEPKFLPHVFDRFRQANSTSTRKYGGLGIGLAIVRHSVEIHGGSVSASSLGKSQGATFRIRLPLLSASRLERPERPRVEAAPTMRERKILENSGRLDGVRVLLVEDNLDTLDMLKFIFDESGAEVITATSVDEALEALERFSPDALVSDIAMPDRDGYDLIREVRSLDPERGGKIPAVAVSAYTKAEDRARVLAAGFQMHIAKPIVPGELIAVVASLTGHIDYGSTGVSGLSEPSGH
jgi:PAS domain S-box-containing protein